MLLDLNSHAAVSVKSVTGGFGFSIQHIGAGATAEKLNPWNGKLFELSSNFNTFDLRVRGNSFKVVAVQFVSFLKEESLPFLVCY